MSAGSAATLRRAARLMQERANAARAGRWWADGPQVRAQWTFADKPVAVCGGSLEQGNQWNAEHIASWHPRAGLDVAEVLRQHAELHDTYDCVHSPCAHETLAITYLGEES